MEDILPFRNRIQGAYLIGEEMEKMAEWCRAHSIAHQKSETLERALKGALHEASQDRRRPATILLAPACKSFDQFKNFEDRGEKFAAMALSLAADVRETGTC